MKSRICICFLITVLFINNFTATVASAEPVKNEISETITVVSEACVLMEASTGKVIYSKNADIELKPASITKIMTLLLIFDALSEGRINLGDSVTVSEHAASLGGSQIFLEPYETQTVEVMIKSIAIASANDASVAMAEHISGSEESFVAAMNERASGLGMEHTRFINCYGLDIDGHYSSAMDVALMSREMITKHPEISCYSTVWMDTITHTTSKGVSEFGLTNTNKLIKTYQGITGLKTGSTSLAKYCLSATATRNGISLISVIMAAPDTKTRFKEAASLLNYGFSNCFLYTDKAENHSFEPVKVEFGTSESVEIICENDFSYVYNDYNQKDNFTYEIVIPETIEAPLIKGDIVGSISYSLNNIDIGSVNLVASQDVAKATYGDCIIKAFKLFTGG